MAPGGGGLMPGAHGDDHSHAPYPRAPGAAQEQGSGELGPAEQTPNGLAMERVTAPGGVESDSGPPILAVEGVTFAYQDGTVALRDLSLALPRGRRTAILGANGSGKSTLFLHLDGILKPQRGRVLLDGAPVAYDRAGLTDLRRRVGLVFQDPDNQLFAASVRQDISFGPLNLGLGEAEVRARVEQAVRDTQIEDLADRPTHLLSYGQKKRVAIAGVLAMAPEVIVADEPTAGLDPESTARLLGLLDRLHGGGRTVVISTHDVELALAWADHALVLRRGELLGAGPPQAVFADAGLVREARLVTPIVLEVYQRLLAAGVALPPGPPPRTAAQLADLVSAGRGGDRAPDAPSAPHLPAA
ncbi:MAG TPA: ABC transporter ATP-binding protein [Chloroflexota bacterium]|nr:ABC transporter ATP-binding protein [Chloroflexota bacterium]